MATNESSGRWDAAGSFEEAVEEQRRLATEWAWDLTVPEIIKLLSLISYDPNSLTLYQRTALLEVTVWHLGEMC